MIPSSGSDWQEMAAALPQAGSQDAIRYITELPVNTASLFATLTVVRGPKSDWVSALKQFSGAAEH